MLWVELGLGELVGLKFSIVKDCVFVVVLGINKWFDELFDVYVVEGSMWGFRFLIGKREGLIIKVVMVIIHITFYRFSQ